LRRSAQLPGLPIIRKIALAHISEQHFQWDVKLNELDNYAGPDSHSPLAPWLSDMPAFVFLRINAHKFGDTMGLQPPLVAVWCRKVRPLSLWEDHPNFKELLETARGHQKLNHAADGYRAKNSFWPSLPCLFELLLGSPSEAARAIYSQRLVPGPASLASTVLPHGPASARTVPDPELADWGRAESLPEEA
jgi:hypothetical protein